MSRGRLLYSEPELRTAAINELIRSSQMVVDELAARLGRPADDFEIRVFAGAFVGAFIAALFPSLDDPRGRFRRAREQGPRVRREGDAAVAIRVAGDGQVRAARARRLQQPVVTGWAQRPCLDAPARPHRGAAQAQPHSSPTRSESGPAGLTCPTGSGCRAAPGGPSAIAAAEPAGSRSALDLPGPARVSAASRRPLLAAARRSDPPVRGCGASWPTSPTSRWRRACSTSTRSSWPWPTASATSEP